MSFRPFIAVERRVYKTSDRWGDMYLIDEKGKTWEKLCFAYELPWVETASGKSRRNVSRIQVGTYPVKVRTGSPKGWRLQLGGTGHRRYIQIHRAHHTLNFRGCILPIAVSDFRENGPQQTTQVEYRSIILMRKIRERWEELEILAGTPVAWISANFPIGIGSSVPDSDWLGARIAPWVSLP